MTFLILEIIDKLTLGIVLRTIWSFPIAVAIAAGKPSVATIESTVVTVGSVVATVESLSNAMLHSWL